MNDPKVAAMFILSDLLCLGVMLLILKVEILRQIVTWGVLIIFAIFVITIARGRIGLWLMDLREKRKRREQTQK